MDSNHRRHCQQIYSLSPLATREFPHIDFLSLSFLRAEPSTAGLRGKGKENGEDGYKAFAASAEAECSALRLPMELVDGFEPPTC